jgi:hypothetical protein
MPAPHKCPNCPSWRTVTHYHHDAISNIGAHDFEIMNPPPPPPPPTPVSGIPIPQPCPIDGCYIISNKGNPAFSYCLDCGHTEIH